MASKPVVKSWRGTQAQKPMKGSKVPGEGKPGFKNQGKKNGK